VRDSALVRISWYSDRTYRPQFFFSSGFAYNKLASEYAISHCGS